METLQRRLLRSCGDARLGVDEKRNMDNRTIKRALLGLAALSLGGCAIGRTEMPGPEWPGIPHAHTEEATKRTVYVSGFYEFTTATSETGSQDIVTIRESASIKDISGEMAIAMREQGVNAVGKRNFRGEGMAPNDLWIRGVATNGNLRSSAVVVGVVSLAVVTGLVIGGILPHPFPATYGPTWELRIEISGANGDIVATHEGDRVAVSYSTIYIWGLSDNHPEDRPTLIKLLAESLAKETQ